MCYLNFKESVYKTSKEYWKALIVNQKKTFTIKDILKYKSRPTKKDTLIILEIIKELGELNCVKRIGNQFYILENLFKNT